MSAERYLHRVSCKCAIFTPDATKVLLADYGSSGYGLPGGHIDEDETPDAAMARELTEELGLKDVVFRHADFLLHPNGKIVLGYIAQLDESTELTTQEDEIDGVVWVGIDDLKSGKVTSPSYRDFILGNIPNVVV